MVEPVAAPATKVAPPRTRPSRAVRVALVQCPAWGPLPPLAAAALTAYLRADGHNVRGIDLNIEFHNEHTSTVSDMAQGGAAYGGPDPWGADAYGQWALDYSREAHDVAFQPGSRYNDDPLPLARWADRILTHDPEIVGFTTYLTSFASSLLLARELRRRKPTVLLVFGGPNVARDREGDIALRTGIPDLVVDGEGEETLRSIAAAIAADQDVTKLQGVGHLHEGEPVWNEGRPLIRKLDTLPFPDFSDFDWADYPNPYLIPIMASRGCVLKCAFCYETVYWKRYRMQSPQRVVAEIEHQVAQHPMRDAAAAADQRFYFMFADSLVNGHLRGLQRTSRLLIERGLPVSWGGQATMDKRMDAEVCRDLRASGCTGLAFGLESGSQRVLDSMGKHFSIQDAARVIRDVHGAGISATVNVMVGFPTERFRDFLATMWFLTKARRWIYQVSNVTTTQVALGSEMHLFPERYGVTIHGDGTWESPETGGESDRRRRLRLLHLWMRFMRIPHQNIAPD